MLIFSSFISKGVAEYMAIKYMDDMNRRIPYTVVITRHRVWSRFKGFGRYDVFIAYSANNLRLTTLYVIEDSEVVDCYKVSE